MSDATEIERLAEADGATFLRAATGAWWARDKDGVTIVRGALSRAEAARLYCEDRNLVASTPEAILEFIRAQYRPYDSMLEFQQGFDAYGQAGVFLRNPYDDTVEPGVGLKAQAWDRGANTAMLYARALAHLDAHKDDVEKAGPGWLAQLLRTGRA
jgi:hypothetical protein